jgi:hypothetical protein
MKGERQYWLAADCPNCGEKNAPDAWKGARHGSTAWGHDFSCCSDKCGIEFRDSPKRWRIELRQVDDQIIALTRHRESLRNKLDLAERRAQPQETKP